MILTTYYDDVMAEVASLTLPSMERWARQKKIQFLPMTGRSTSRYGVYWQKIHQVEQLLRTQKEDILWLDIDCLVVGDIFLPTDQQKIYTGKDAYGICCGMLWLQNATRVKEFVSAWYLTGPMDESDRKNPKHDQATLKHLMANFPSWENMVEGIPDKMSDPDLELKNAFVYHAWTSGRPMHEAIRELGVRI